MQQYGNNFEVLSCSNVDLVGNRSEDWSIYGESKLCLATSLQKQLTFRNTKFPILLEHKDWDETLFIPGGSVILKKNIWEKCKWDERLHWGEEEDVYLSHLQIFRGIIPRFNVESTHITFEQRGNNGYSITFNSKKRGIVNKPMRYCASMLIKKIRNGL
jgi:hypothetical protein